MSAVHGQESPSYETIKQWKWGCQVWLHHLTGWLKGVLFIDSHRTKCGGKGWAAGCTTLSARKVNIGRGSNHNILHDVLHRSKVVTWWVPRLLTPIWKQQHMDAVVNQQGIVVCVLGQQKMCYLQIIYKKGRQQQGLTTETYYKSYIIMEKRCGLPSKVCCC